MPQICRDYCCVRHSCRTRDTIDAQRSCQQVGVSTVTYHLNSFKHWFVWMGGLWQPAVSNQWWTEWGTLCFVPCQPVHFENLYRITLDAHLWCSVRFLTGHSRKGGDDPLYVAEQAADPDSTLVIYMGLATLPGLAAKLMAHGLSPDTPAAAIERGTTPQQRVVNLQPSPLKWQTKFSGLLASIVLLEFLWLF